MKKLIYITIIGLLFTGSVVSAQDSILTVRKIPTLSGHSFPSIGYLRSSFVNTSLLTYIGIGSTTVVRYPGIDIGDHEIPPFEGNILFLTMKVKYQQKFTPWLGLYFSMNVAGRVGTDLTTILADGVNTISGGDIGWIVRIMKRDKFNLSGTINLKNLNGSFINIAEFVDDVINDVPNPTVIKKVPAMSIGPGIQGAYAINPTFGLQFYGEMAYGESFERGASKAYYLAGLAGDVDFLPKQRVPIGLALGYTITSAPEVVMNSGDYASFFMGKLGYTGADEFELGLQMAYYNVKMEGAEGDKNSVTSFLLVLKFYF